MLPANHSFDNLKATRMIALGYPLDEIIAEFEPLISLVIRRSVSFDTRNIDEDDLKQIARLKVADICKDFKPTKSSLFVYASTVLRHTLWSSCKLGPADYARTPEEVDLDARPSDYTALERVERFKLPGNLVDKLRVEGDPKAEVASRYVYGIFCSGLYDGNKARVLKTLTYGLDLNPKMARYLVDQVLLQLRVIYSSHGSDVKEVRDDPFFYNKFKHSVIPELREIIGERAFERLVHFFGGLSITVPSKELLDSIDRDLHILKSLTADWNSSLQLSRAYGISPEGIKTVFKSCLHRLQTDVEYRNLVSAELDLNKIPYYSDPADPKPKKKAAPDAASKKRLQKRMMSTDSMGFQIGSRNSLMYTMIVTGRCTRHDLVEAVHKKFGGTLQSAKSTVSAFLSDIKHPFGKFNTSRSLTILMDSESRLSFERNSLDAAQIVIAERRKANLEAVS